MFYNITINKLTEVTDSIDSFGKIIVARVHEDNGDAFAETAYSHVDDSHIVPCIKQRNNSELYKMLLLNFDNNHDRADEAYHSIFSNLKDNTPTVLSLWIDDLD